MIVDDLDVVGVAIMPNEADSELLVDSNRVLTITITAKCLEVISRAKVRQSRRGMQASQSATGGISKSIERRDTLALDEALGALVPTAPNHSWSLVRSTYNVKKGGTRQSGPLPRGDCRTFPSP
jgi:hypothetical protein